MKTNKIIESAEIEAEIKFPLKSIPEFSKIHALRTAFVCGAQFTIDEICRGNTDFLIFGMNISQIKKCINECRKLGII